MFQGAEYIRPDLKRHHSNSVLNLFGIFAFCIPKNGKDRLCAHARLIKLFLDMGHDIRDYAQKLILWLIRCGGGMHFANMGAV
jgi:hypothetical protein